MFGLFSQVGMGGDPMPLFILLAVLPSGSSFCYRPEEGNRVFLDSGSFQGPSVAAHGSGMSLNSNVTSLVTCSHSLTTNFTGGPIFSTSPRRLLFPNGIVS